MRVYMDRRVTPPSRVTSPTRGPPPPCKQALNEMDGFFNLPWLSDGTLQLGDSEIMERNFTSLRRLKIPSKIGLDPDPAFLCCLSQKNPSQIKLAVSP